MRQRHLQPEHLDRLPHDAAETRRLRAELRRLNRLMGNFWWMAQALRRHVRPGEGILEIGAGDGALAEYLRHSKSLGPTWAMDGLDRCPRPACWPSAAQWHQTDVATFTGFARYPVVIANLLLHQLDDATLAHLGTIWRQHCRLLLFCETHRSWRARVLCWLSPAIGVGRLGLHDAVASVRAGFREPAELAARLGFPLAEPDDWAVPPEAPGWVLGTHCGHLGQYRFVAERRDQT